MSAKVGGRFLRCHICGREFTAASLPIHKPQCIEKFEREQAKLPKDQRRPLPKEPETNAALTREQYNEAAYKEFMDSGRQPCPNCRRGFVGKALEIHLRSCTPGGFFAKKADPRKGPESDDDEQEIKTSSSVRPKPQTQAQREKPRTQATKPPSSYGSRTVMNPKSPVSTSEDDLNSPVSSSHSKFCVECGEKFSDTDKFCRECGTRRS